MRPRRPAPAATPVTERGTTKGKWLTALRSTSGQVYSTVGRFVWRTDGNGEGYVRICRNIHSDADTHLIAACPDLYEACLELVRGGSKDPSHSKAIEMAIAALERADGNRRDPEEG